MFVKFPQGATTRTDHDAAAEVVYDAVIVGAGIAGSIIASRLSADGMRVLLLIRPHAVPVFEIDAVILNWFPPQLIPNLLAQLLAVRRPHAIHRLQRERAHLRNGPRAKQVRSAIERVNRLPGFHHSSMPRRVWLILPFTE